MSKTLKPIEAVMEVVVVTPAQSIVDQVLDLPVNSIVISVPKVGYGGTDALIRTGIVGWLSCREPMGLEPSESKYLKNPDVKAWVKHREKICDITVVHQPIS